MMEKTSAGITGTGLWAEYFHIRPEPDLETICDPWVGEANETGSFCAYLLEGLERSAKSA